MVKMSLTNLVILFIAVVIINLALFRESFVDASGNETFLKDLLLLLSGIFRPRPDASGNAVVQV